MRWKKPPKGTMNRVFELEESIADWRVQLLAAGIETPVPLEETESHLRDGVDLQLESRINAQTGFQKGNRAVRMKLR
jgi:hypothetical protein